MKVSFFYKENERRYTRARARTRAHTHTHTHTHIYVAYKRLYKNKKQ